MATPTQKIYSDAAVELPTSYVAPPNLDMEFAAVRAKINGASASGAFIVVLELLSQDGRIMAQSRIDQEYAVGDTGANTWAPFLRRKSRVSAAVDFIGARIENHTVQSIPNNTQTARIYDTVIFDTDNMVNLGVNNDRITITRAGVYLVLGATNYVANAVGRRICNLLINGTTTGGGGTVIGNFSLPAVADAGARTVSPAVGLVECVAGDFLASSTFQLSGGALDEAGPGAVGNSFLSCVRVGV